MGPVWRIRLLGEFCAHCNTEPPAQFDTRQSAALLAYLALNQRRAHPRDLLATRLWPDEDSEATRSRLRTALWALRRVLEPEGVAPNCVLIADRADVRLVVGAATTDVSEFEDALQEATHATDATTRAACYCRACEVYAGELLPGWYEEWANSERIRLAEAYRRALSQAAEALATSGDLYGAIGYARRAVAADTLQEEAHALLIGLYVRTGRPVDAVRQYQELERLLRVEIGLKPSPATRAILTDIHSPASPPPAVASAPGQVVFSPTINVKLVPPGGAMAVDSPFYIEREIDSLFMDAISRQDSIVLVKGARQVGKTSLLARGLKLARVADTRVVMTDLQKFTTTQLQTSDSLFLTLARDIADQLSLDIAVEDLWHPSWGWNVNFERFLRREVLKLEYGPLVWGLDEVDRLFGRPDSADIFGLFRSWHNARSLNPEGPWSRLTLAMAFATEAHLFITDLNQSPFNVGTRLTLGDFTPGEVAELNRRYHSPLENQAELTRYFALVGGHPYLVQRGLYVIATTGLSLADFEAESDQEDGQFSDHLRRMRHALQKDSSLYAAVRAVLQGQPCPSNEEFFRLQSAGVLVGKSHMEARLRCGIYQRYLANHPLTEGNASRL